MVDINQKALTAAYRVFCQLRGTGNDAFEGSVKFYLDAAKVRNAAPEYPKTDHEALSIALQEHITGTAARFRALETRIQRLETKGDTE